jgi:uncharacterized protein YcbK (DUF882 family)
VLAVLLVLLASTSLQDAVADGDTRTLSFQHTHRDDAITITFKRNGRYDEDGLKKLNYFLRDWRTNEETKMDPRLFDVLWEVYRDVGGKEPINIVSSYRSPATNSMLRRRSRGVAEFSQHTLGKAIDFFIPGVSLEQIRFAGLRQQRGGVGYYPTSGSPFVHVDVGSIRHWPRMTHDQLARVFPDGKTVHVPSDGVPLKNYQVALAEAQRRGSTPSATSLSAAQNAGIQVADVSGGGGGRNFLAKLFGIGKEEDDDNEGAPPARGTQPAAASPPSRQEVAAAVPLPRARPTLPGDAQPAAGGEFSLASASSRPARLSPAPAPQGMSDNAPQSPADIINSRGFWDNDIRAAAAERNAATALTRMAAAPSTVAPSAGTPSAATPSAATPSAAAPSAAPPSAEPREAVAPTGERLVWNAGPEGQAQPPRPPRDIEGAPANDAAGADDTASIASWASDPAQKAGNAALSYAANTAPQQAATAASAAAAAPMGAMTPTGAATRQAAAAPANTGTGTVATKRAAANSPAAKIVPRGNDPWLRGIVMTPSVHYALSVSPLGTQDGRTLRPLIAKPTTTVAMVFSNDPTLGLTSLQFTGPAVTFLPTLNHPTRTAGLN